MRLRLKIILVVLPIIIAAVLIAGLTSAFSARQGITRIAVEALGFKAQELEKYATNQWDLLVANDLAENPDYIHVTERAVESYAQSLVRPDGSELILAIDESGSVVMATSEIEIVDPTEIQTLQILAAEGGNQWTEIELDGTTRVGQTFSFAPFNWLVMVTDTTDSFYAEVDSIRVQTYIIVAIAAVVAILFIAIFSNILTTPLSRMVDIIQEITEENNLSKRVEVEYRDEIGAMAKKFNGMLSQLQSADANLKSAYDKVKEQAYRAEISQFKEFRTRKMFERYVPSDVVETISKNPEAALVGDNRILAILFSDIRSFTTISEGLEPEIVVESLNRYFSVMVPIIKSHNGIVDKYIGDAIMAFFGAPVKHENDSLDAVQAGLEMLAALPEFNARQKSEGLPEFRIGVGVEYGVVTVGNIGCEDKMDYTIIGDKVNSGSRLEGLNKKYGQQLLISQSVFSRVKGDLACRLVDNVQVKGRGRSEEVYTTASGPNPTERKAWQFYHAGIKRYRKREFEEARKYFTATARLLPGDSLATLYLRHCNDYLSGKKPMPKGENWFATKMDSK